MKNPAKALAFAGFFMFLSAIMLFFELRYALSDVPLGEGSF